MLAKTENLIDRKLQEIEEFGKLEDILIDSDSPEKEQELLTALDKYKDLIAEVAYLAGYKQGIKEEAAADFAKNPAEYMNIIEFRKMLDKTGVRPK